MKIIGYSDSKSKAQKMTEKIRPKTAQAYSFNKILEILEGKYASFNTAKILQRSIENQNTFKQRNTQNHSSKTKKSSKNMFSNAQYEQYPSHGAKFSYAGSRQTKCIQEQKKSKENYKSLGKKQEKLCDKKKQRFIKYSQQSQPFTKTENTLIWQMPKTLKSQKLINKTKIGGKVKQKQAKDSTKKNDEMMQKSALTSWKSDEELGISILMNKNWNL